MPYWRLHYHFVWGVKQRLPLILPTFEKRLYRSMAAKAIELGAFIHAVGGIEDHVHLAVSVPPKISLARFVGEVKGNASHFINHVIEPDGGFYWQEEYGVVSFGEKNLPFVVRYVQEQRRHHYQGTAIDGLERVDE